jgi:hypothetical protein
MQCGLCWSCATQPPFHLKAKMYLYPQHIPTKSTISIKQPINMAPKVAIVFVRKILHPQDRLYRSLY